jgi:hypothetical protein
MRFDEHVGFNFALIANTGAASELPAERRNALQSIDWSAESDSKRRLQCIVTVKVLRGSSAGSSA